MQSRFMQFIPTRNRERRGRVPRQVKLLNQTQWRCGYCACDLTRQTVTRDHIVPKSQGGKTCNSNLIACCRGCNQRKGDLDVELFRELYFAGGPFWLEIVKGDAA